MKNTFATGTSHTQLASQIFTVCGVWMIGLGLYFALLRPPLLPEDLRFVGLSLADLHAAAPKLQQWLSRVFTVMGGFMVGAGVLTIFVAHTAIRIRSRGAGWALLFAGVSTVALMSAINFSINSDFKWLLLGPALLWVAGVSLYALAPRQGA